MGKKVVAKKKLSNKALLKSAAHTTAQIQTAGRLNDRQAERFIDFVIEITGLKGRVRTVRFRNDKMDIDKIGLGNRVSVAKKEARDPGIRRKANFTKITLQPEEIMVPWEISDELILENLEGDRVEQTIMRIMATAMSNDMEELQIQGDKEGHVRYESEIVDNGSDTQAIVDTFLGLQDGYLKLAGQSNVVDHDLSEISHTVFSDMIIAMPSKFKRTKRNLRFFVSDTDEQLFRNHLAARATGLGDQAATSELNLRPFGIELVPLALLPHRPLVTEKKVLNGTTAVGLKNKGLVDGTEVVVLDSIGANPRTPVTPFASGVDYTFDAEAGTLARVGAGAIGDGETVRITYESSPQMFLTEFRNLILGIGRDIRVERDRNIFAGVSEFAMTVKLGTQIEEASAVVLGINLGSGGIDA